MRGRLGNVAGRLSCEVHRSWLVVGVCVGVIMGSVLLMMMRINYLFSPVWGLVALLLFIFAYIKPRTMLVGVMVVVGTMVIFVRATSELMGADYVRQLFGETVVVNGVIEGDPETDETGTKVKLGELKFGNESEHGVDGKLFFTLSKNEGLARDDRLVVKGKMSDGFGTYAGYMFRPKLVKWERAEPGNWVVGVRNWFAERVRRLVTTPEVDLGLSYLLGMRTGLTEELNDKLRVVGLVHIVVASGAHLSILVEVARKIFGRLSRFAGILFAGVFVVFFMAMVGWTPSIMRAGLMALLTLVTWYCGRKIAPWRLILIVAAVTLMIEPNHIINLGWLLSFASYAGIMILGPRMTRFFYGEKKPGFIGSTMITTIAATLMTMPIVLYYYGTLSLISVVANLLILPTLPVAMGLVFLTGVVCGLVGIEGLVAWCATKILDFHIMVVNFFGGQRVFLVEIEPYCGWIFGVYVLIGVAVLYGWLRRLWYNRKYEKHI